MVFGVYALGIAILFGAVVVMLGWRRLARVVVLGWVVGILVEVSADDRQMLHTSWTYLIVLSAHLRLLILVLWVMLVGVGFIVVALVVLPLAIIVLILLLHTIGLVVSSVLLLPRSCKIRVVFFTLVVGMGGISIAIRDFHGNAALGQYSFASRLPTDS